MSMYVLVLVNSLGLSLSIHFYAVLEEIVSSLLMKCLTCWIVCRSVDGHVRRYDIRFGKLCADTVGGRDSSTVCSCACEQISLRV